MLRYPSTKGSQVYGFARLANGDNPERETMVMVDLAEDSPELRIYDRNWCVDST